MNAFFESSGPASLSAISPKAFAVNTTTVKICCGAVVSILALLFLVSQTAHSAERPNILVILSDDQGWGDLSLNGNRNLQTPRIDSLARDGVQFDRFYVCPVCSPTRAEFLTGRYHPRSGVYSTSSGGERMNLDEVTVADSFASAGYRTAAFGKWHNGMQYPYHPNGRGFQEFYGFCSGHWGDYFSPPLERNGQLVQGAGFCIDDFTNHAIAFMEQSVSDQRPFFVYLPYNTPHSPMQVPDSYWKKFEHAELTMRNRQAEREDIQHTRAALAMCENIDWNVGRLLDRLESLNIADNTIVLYFCDNGPNGVRWNGDMLGRKGSTDEGGVRSPLLVRWPNKIMGGRVITPIAAAIDLHPTLAELADVPLASTKPVDGKSLAGLLTQSIGGDSAANWPDRNIVSHWNGKVSVRNQRFRLSHTGELFEIDTDPGQRRNVAEQHPEICQRLQQVADGFRQEFKDYDNDQRPFLLGHATYQYTQVPARDATATGKIQRSNRFPNCSFFTNWTSTDEQLVWDLEVAASGTYQVDLQYTCPEDDVGSTVELAVGASRLRTKILTPHDPPLRGQEHDRTPRQESYVKDFATMSLGTIELQKGSGPMTLSAIEIPGKQVMDFRLLMFTRVSN